MIKKLFTRRENIIFNIALGVAVFSVFFVFLVVPALRKAEILNKEISLTRMKLIKYTRLLGRSGDIRNKYAPEQGLVIEGKGRQLSILSVIEKLAKESNIRIIDMRPQNQKEIPPNIDFEITVDIRTEGQIEGYARFLYEIENSLFLLRVKKLQLGIKPDSQTLEGSFAIAQLFVAD